MEGRPTERAASRLARDAAPRRAVFAQPGNLPCRPYCSAAVMPALGRFTYSVSGASSVPGAAGGCASQVSSTATTLREKYFAAVQPDLALKAKRILEVNVEHPAFAALESARITDPDRAKKYAEILLNQAMLIAGLPLENPSDYTDLVCSLWK